MEASSVHLPASGLNGPSPRPTLTTDSRLFTAVEDDLRILLIHCGLNPFKRPWHCPAASCQRTRHWSNALPGNSGKKPVLWVSNIDSYAVSRAGSQVFAHHSPRG
jgi:hypothetical protein